MRTDEKALLTIDGFVDGEDWDSDGQLTMISISTDDDRYYIQPRGKSAELLELSDYKVRVTGTVERRKDRSFITVESYEVLDDYYDDDDNDDPEYAAWVDAFNPRVGR